MSSCRIPCKPTYTTSIRLTDCEIKAYREFAKSQGLTVSEAIRKTMEKEIANTTAFKNDLVNN